MLHRKAATEHRRAATEDRAAVAEHGSTAMNCVSAPRGCNSGVTLYLRWRSCDMNDDLLAAWKAPGATGCVETGSFAEYLTAVDSYMRPRPSQRNRFLFR